DISTLSLHDALPIWAILTGLISLACCAFLFPLFDGPPVWSVLLFLVGVGDYLLHFSTQLWVTSTSPAETRGRHITLYGFAFGARSEEHTSELQSREK